VPLGEETFLAEELAGGKSLGGGRHVYMILAIVGSGVSAFQHRERG
jgi:hypothetical protein